MAVEATLIPGGILHAGRRTLDTVTLCMTYRKERKGRKGPTEVIKSNCFG